MSNENENKKGTFIHGIGASEHLDSSGERIKVKGIDISSLTKDGVFNFEHQSKEASSIVGKVTEAKKILKEDDCENKHHKYFWNKIKKPFLYVAGELFDADGHQAAKDVAAMLRYDVRNKDKKETKRLVNFSIEGQKLENDGAVITKSIARKISITITPCNKVCEAELLDPKDIENGEKMKKFGDNENNFSFVQDLMSKNEGHFASCEPIYKDEFTPNVKPDTGYGKIIDVTKPKKENYGKVIGVGNKPKENYGKVIMPKPAKPKKPGFGKVIVKGDGKVEMPASEAVEEHEHLVDVLESKSHKDDKKEAKKQKKELKEYRKEVKKSEDKSKKKKDGRYDPGRKAPDKHGHHTIPVGESAEHADWHLRNLWETKDQKGGYRTIKDMPAKEHVKLHADRRRKVKKSDDEIPFPLGKPKTLRDLDIPKPKEPNKKKDILEKDNDAPEQMYHIRYQGNRITNKPQTLKQIQETHGNVKNLESQGYRLVHHNPAPKPIGKAEDIIEKFEFFNRVANKFNQFMNRRAVDRTAKKLQAQREAQGQSFDPDATVIADPKKVALGSGKKPEFKEQPFYMPKNRPRFIFPSDETMLNPKPHIENRSQIENPALKQAWDKDDTKMFQQKAKQKAKQSGSLDEKTVTITPTKKSIHLQNNMRKALTAGMGIGAPSTLVGGAALQPEYIDGAVKKKKKEKKKKEFTKSEKRAALKIMSDEAFNQFEKKEELIDYLSKSFPNRSDKEILALAKTVAYVHIKKKEIKLENLMKSKNVREQRKKVFGTNAMPTKTHSTDHKTKPGQETEMHKKHMNAISDFVQKFLGLKLNPSGGKINEETGERRDENPQEGVDKPDWRSGQLEAQWNPDAAIHELGHLFLLPKGVGLEDAQRLMDEQYGDVQKEYGYLQQKRSKHEVESMAAEQIIRRVIGLPATEHDAPTGRDYVGKQYSKKKQKMVDVYKPRYEKDDPRKTSVEDPEKEIALRLPKSQMREGRELKEQIKAKTQKIKQTRGVKTKEKLEGELGRQKEKLAGYSDEYHDLVRLSRQLSPENRQMLHRRLAGQEKFHPVHGWHDADTPDAKINQRAGATQRTEVGQPNQAPEEPVKKAEDQKVEDIKIDLMKDKKVKPKKMGKLVPKQELNDRKNPVRQKKKAPKKAPSKKQPKRNPTNV